MRRLSQNISRYIVVLINFLIGSDIEHKSWCNTEQIIRIRNNS